jgi:excisionase family DNA binding protein
MHGNVVVVPWRATLNEGRARRGRDVTSMSRTQLESSPSNQLRFEVERPAVALTQPLLSGHQAAGILSVRPSWIYDAARRGELLCVRLGKHVRFLRSDLERWVARQRSQ